MLSKGDKYGLIGLQFFKQVKKSKKSKKVLIQDRVLPKGIKVDINILNKEISGGRGREKKKDNNNKRGRGKAKIKDNNKDI